MIEIGQLRRWNSNAGSSGELFLVIGFTESLGDCMFVDYIMNGEFFWDDEDWVEEYSEVIDETG
jgi:hypothetical protein